jgi:hypothetical protein
MPDRPSLIMIQFLSWVAEQKRTREQAVEAWHSCPHISVWEDAIVDGLVCTQNDGTRTIALTQHGRAVLQAARAPRALISVKSPGRSGLRSGATERIC